LISHINLNFINVKINNYRKPNSLIIIGLCYLGIGAAYNYHFYKAHGWDLLPHL